MLFSAQRDFSLNLSRCVFLGDDERDGAAAAAAHCGFIRVEDGQNLLAVVKQAIQEFYQE
jgi:D-glycero-D-manno-heptose 1,7-bisphosphate phosphatase